jgi:hypothetical protein
MNLEKELERAKVEHQQGIQQHGQLYVRPTAALTPSLITRTNTWTPASPHVYDGGGGPDDAKGQVQPDCKPHLLMWEAHGKRSTGPHPVSASRAIPHGVGRL